ncbi:MAG: GAF domain-containing protein [Paracoccaceae bacterium]
MQPTPHPLQQARLEALHDLEVLDTPREAPFDTIVAMAAEICRAPVALISLVDEKRQWFKARVGVALDETGLDRSICAHAIHHRGLTVIEDTLEDPRSRDNPLCCTEPGLRFYAGAPIETEDGLPLGTLCVLDYHPRRLAPREEQLLAMLARQAAAQIVLRRDAQAARDLLQEIDHRVKNSLAMVTGLLGIQMRQAGDDPRLVEALDRARARVGAVALTHDLLHRTAGARDADLHLFVGRLFDGLAAQGDGRVAFVNAAPNLAIKARAITNIGIVLNELATNALRHGFPEPVRGTIRLEGGVQRDDLVLRLVDDGRGLPAGFDAKARHGFGTSICLTLARQMGGTLDWGGRPGRTVSTLRLPMTSLT